MAVYGTLGARLLFGTAAANQLTDTYIPVGEVENFGDIGPTFGLTTFTDVENGFTRKIKTARNDGSQDLMLGLDQGNAGQRAMRNAATQRFSYNLQIVLPDSAPPSAPTTVTITIAGPGVVTWNAHGFTTDTPVVFSTTGALPTGLVAGTTYFVRNPTTNSFELSATRGGLTSITTTGTQSGVHTGVSAPVGTTLFYKAKIMSAPFSLGNVEGVMKCSVKVEIDTGTIIVLDPVPNVVA